MNGGALRIWGSRTLSGSQGLLAIFSQRESGFLLWSGTPKGRKASRMERERQTSGAQAFAGPTSTMGHRGLRPNGPVGSSPPISPGPCCTVVTLLSFLLETRVQLSSVAPNPGASDAGRLHQAAEVRPHRDRSSIAEVRPPVEKSMPRRPRPPRSAPGPVSRKGW